MTKPGNVKHWFRGEDGEIMFELLSPKGEVLEDPVPTPSWDREPEIN
jgi:hypothetical protein